MRGGGGKGGLVSHVKHLVHSVHSLDVLCCGDPVQPAAMKPGMKASVCCVEC